MALISHTTTLYLGVKGTVEIPRGVTGVTVGVVMVLVTVTVVIVIVVLTAVMRVPRML
jgi:hypothetical protein